MTLDERLQDAYGTFTAEVLSHVSPGTASKITLDVWAGSVRHDVLISDKSVTGPAFVFVDADGTPEEVARRVEDAVLDKKPWLVS